MAAEYGLFDDGREFLIGIDDSEDVYAPEQAWVRVWLLGGWDFVDSEVEQLRAGWLVGARI
ncbi:hypothetical protein CFP65_7114 [Kitasatospora sp. MMS16-BH015]|uniref:hypothetical protein n=1 Tax=Kitasatospora sp. MMS16-BH015 TaxID=2018025 RepID=UPI000CA3B85E|nr:hypothetical protein [Kitasatospora sp. MMS16-BH015]AUG81715.1 hypothetical protein CFP65_7114 [Kitasatospora sp. MMS16-BH015]